MCPQVIQADNLQTIDFLHFVAENSYPHSTCQPGDSRCDLGMRPVGAVVVVPQNAKGGTAPDRQMGKHSADVVVDIRLVAREIARIDDDPGRKFLHAIKGVDQKGIVYPRTDVQIAQLRHSGTHQPLRQVRYRQSPLNELQPVRLPSPGVKTHRCSKRGGHR